MRTSTVVLAALLTSVALAPEIGTASAAAPETQDAAGVVSGVVKDHNGRVAANVLVILECTCLQSARTTTTSAGGLFRFRDVPPGNYSIRVVSEHQSRDAVFDLARGERRRLSFRLPPAEHKPARIVRTPHKSTAVGRTVTMEEFRNVPAGNSTSRDYTTVVESSVRAARDAAGISLSGTTASPYRVASEPFNREAYAHHAEADFVTATDQPLSTFSVDVDTASYANIRRFLAQGQRPPPDAVRIEEMINYFDYDYAEPQDDRPVAVNWELGRCPWNTEHVLARVGLQTKHIEAEQVPPRNLVFLLDVSGSMASHDKLPLLQQAMLMLVDHLRREDRVSIVVYAGSAGLVLPPTRGDDKETIRDAIRMLQPGGSTNGAGGIHLAYDMAKRGFMRRGANRVILATDGDFNVGTSSEGELVRLIEDKRKSKVFLSVLGFGGGNLQDSKMELLADKGNGNYSYIDSTDEAEKVLVQEAGATLVTVAKDVKLQIEFNPERVAEYRLIGYDNRRLANEDFANDAKDAGEMGAGHNVTAMYELVPASTGKGKPRVDALKYQSARTRTANAASDEWMTVKIRYKRPDADTSRVLTVPMRGRPRHVQDMSKDLRFAAAVAEFGMVLHDSQHAGTASLAGARTLARDAIGADPHSQRSDLLDLIDAAEAAR